MRTDYELYTSRRKMCLIITPNYKQFYSIDLIAVSLRIKGLPFDKKQKINKSIYHVEKKYVYE